MSDTPLLSIVTPSFNQAAYLEQTMKSVLEQDYSQIEYIVIDGGSTDGSVDIIKKYADRLAYWISEKDKGQAEAINKGLSRATGEILAWLNSDDYYLPGAISAAVKTFKGDPDIVLVYGNMLAVDGNGQTINILRYNQLTVEELLCFQIIGQPAVFMRRDAFENVGGLSPTFHYLLDHHLWLRLALQGHIMHVDETWAAARYHSEAKNIAKPIEFSREAFRILDEAAQDEKLAPILARVNRRARASAHRVDARYQLDGEHPWKSLSAWFRAFLFHPPTALARMNLLVSSLLYLVGLDQLRDVYLKQRKNRLNQR